MADIIVRYQASGPRRKAFALDEVMLTGPQKLLQGM